MRGFLRTRRATSLPRIGALVVALLMAWPAAVPAQASDARLDDAQAQREAVQERLNEVLATLDAAQAATARVEDRVNDLRAEADGYARTARQAQGLLQARIREVYKQGQMPVAFSLLSTDPDGPDAERARLLSVLAVRHREDSEEATGARLRAAASAEAVASAMTELRARQAELDAAREDVQAALAEAQAHETDVEQTIAAEIAERLARQRAARQSTASTTNAPAAEADAADAAEEPESSGDAGSAAVSGGIACPVGTPRSYSDTYGAPRSGGRSHMGVDILAPSGTPSYAYESGTITRMDGNSLGGISLYLQGDSGNVYYYTHLSGYAASAGVGNHVSAGEHIAYVGDTGNAAGIPHLHWEVMPGGGSSVNPYPYAFQACG